MAVHVSWMHNRKLLHCKFEGDISLEALDMVKNQISTLTHLNAHCYHLYVDLTEVRSYPTRIIDMYNIFSSLQNERKVSVIVVSKDKHVIFVVSVLATTLNLPIQIHETYESSMMALYELDPTLRTFAEVHL